MSRRFTTTGGWVHGLLVVALAAGLALPPGLSVLRTDVQAPATETMARAGVAVVDASWNVGASAGQFTAKQPPGADGRFDPYAHSLTARESDGLGSRITTRALVIEGVNGERVAIVANDLYLSQDLLNRRVVSLLEEHDRLVALGLEDGPATGISHDNLTVNSSHSHNSPYYSTPSWGVWVFQDVMDLRFFEYMAERMAEAVIAASRDLRPVRIGGASSTFNEITSHTYGPRVGTDGLPTSAPYDHTTGEVSVVRIDDMSDPGDPQPYALWLVKGVHPEWTWGDDLMNGDITHAAMRIIDRELGVTTVWSQRETGTAGPHKDLRVHAPEARREFQELGFAMMDPAARLLADTVKSTWDDIGAGTPEIAHAYAPLATDVEVHYLSKRFAPPPTRPYPGVSNCNTDQAVDGNPGVPILGLPDCTFPFGGALGPLFDAAPLDLSHLYDELKRVGVPIPDSYSPTSLTGVQETNAVHLQVFRIGEIVATFCPCEQFTDQALNIQTRLDRVEGNIWLGWDWTTQSPPTREDWCVQNADSTWTCADPRNPTRDLPPVSDIAYRRMVAQINNDAAGWEQDAASLFGESEPWDPDEIKGNFTHEEFPEHGYGLVLAVGMANDYWGYVNDYRDYRAHDHYRKALNALGPHGQDWLATRLSRMAVALNGGPAFAPGPLDTVFTAESLRAQVTADTVGELARAYVAAYEPTLPADGGSPTIVDQPADVTRFDAAHLRFVGGSNWTDLPDVTVERLDDGAWRPFATTDGEVQLMVDFPSPDDLPAWRAGEFTWVWTAAFEAFNSEISQPDASGVIHNQTPEGTYRFVVDGAHRSGTPAQAEVYRLVSEPFTVSPWNGITIPDIRLDHDGTVSFTVGPSSTYTFGTDHSYEVGPIDYPDTYDSPFLYIQRGERRLYTYGLADPARHQQYCVYCTFRPWADISEVASATLTVERANGRLETHAARFDTETGRWHVDVTLRPTERAWVDAGGIVDAFGETNGDPSRTVTREPGRR